MIEDFAAAAKILNALRTYGVTVALDDFGGDRSSMRALVRLPLDRLKIDGAFVVDALANPRCTAVIRAAARLAKELGLALTGKGVETCSNSNCCVRPVATRPRAISTVGRCQKRNSPPCSSAARAAATAAAIAAIARATSAPLSRA